jgi:hypothetical protein
VDGYAAIGHAIGAQANGTWEAAQEKGRPIGRPKLAVRESQTIFHSPARGATLSFVESVGTAAFSKRLPVLGLQIATWA